MLAATRRCPTTPEPSPNQPRIARQPGLHQVPRGARSSVTTTDGGAGPRPELWVPICGCAAQRVRCHRRRECPPGDRRIADRAVGRPSRRRGERAGPGLDDQFADGEIAFCVLETCTTSGSGHGDALGEDGPCSVACQSASTRTARPVDPGNVTAVRSRMTSREPALSAPASSSRTSTGRTLRHH